MADREPTSRDMHEAMLLEQLAEDPRTREKLHEIVSVVLPKEADRFLPDVAIKNALAPALAELQKERDEFRAEKEKDRQAGAIAALNESLKSYGVRDAEIPAVHKYMRDHNVLDTKLAVMGYREETKVAVPPGRGYGVTIPGQPNSGKFFEGRNGGPSIMEDRVAWRRDVINETVADLAAGRPLSPMDA